MLDLYYCVMIVEGDGRVASSICSVACVPL